MAGYVHDMYADPAIKANALKLYRANCDRTLHDPALAPGSRVEVVAGAGHFLQLGRVLRIFLMIVCR